MRNPGPPNYRLATVAGQACAGCEMFFRGECWGYGDVHVSDGNVCDSFTPDPSMSDLIRSLPAD